LPERGLTRVHLADLFVRHAQCRKSFAGTSMLPRLLGVQIAGVGAGGIGELRRGEAGLDGVAGGEAQPQADDSKKGWLGTHELR
jgi:hypothetical protein